MKKNISIIFFSIIVLLISYFTYFRNYQYPSNLFWDENYHIASAQKYLNGVFFMEPHPPLGKLFIALGEYLIQPNKKINTRSFLATDYIKDIPKGYSFAGVRFFPTLFATLSAVLFYLILYTLSKRPILSFLFTSLYLFENAIIVHSRGAMLEPIQMFFVLFFLLFSIEKINTIDYRRWKVEGRKLKVEAGGLKVIDYIQLGFLYGLAVSVKLNSGSLGILVIILLAKEYYHRVDLKQIFIKSLVFMLTAVSVLIGFYYIHIYLGKTVVDKRYYEASGQYKKMLNNQYPISNVQSPISNIQTNFNSPFLRQGKQFPNLLKEHLQFIFHYEKGVPKYDVCKVGENGSLPVTWPFGNKAINYRWEKSGESVRYLYLQGNPMVWLLGLGGLFFSLNLIVSSLFFKTKITNNRLFSFITTFSILYATYMASMMMVERVLYLYHYFIPLIFSLILSYLMFLYLFEEGLKKKKVIMVITVIAIITIIILVYFFFSPLTYYQPLTHAQFELRNWFRFWGLKSLAK